MRSGRPEIFFDRDGVLNVDAGYLFRSEQLRWMPGAMAAVRRANELGFVTVVVTNQSGVARGLYTEADIVALHNWMQQELGTAGARIDAFYYCPHHPEGSEAAYRMVCECRKPLPGMLLQAARDLDIDLASSILIGPGSLMCISGDEHLLSQLLSLLQMHVRGSMQRLLNRLHVSLAGVYTGSGNTNIGFGDADLQLDTLATDGAFPDVLQWSAPRR